MAIDLEKINIIIPCTKTRSLINLLEYFLLKSPFESMDIKPIISTIKVRINPTIIIIGITFEKKSICYLLT